MYFREKLPWWVQHSVRRVVMPWALVAIWPAIALLAFAPAMGQFDSVTSPDLDLSPDRRDRIVDATRSALEGAIVGSAFTLRGSLADESADRYSDIDGVWRVPDGRVQVSRRRAARST